MRSYSFTCLALMVAGALACDSKGGGSSDTSDLVTDSDDSSTDGSGTDGVSSTDGTGGPMTSGGSSNTSETSGTATDATSTGSTTGANPTSTSTGTTNMTTIGPVTEGTGDVPPDEPAPCEGEAVELDVAANAYLYSQQPPMPDPTGGSSGTGGDPLDPDTVFVRLSNKVATCADPDPSLECGSNWEVSIAIPPSYQTPGLYHLHGPEVTGHQFETGEDEGGGECSWGGGSFDATFELISIDDKTVTGRLCHVNSNFFDVQVDLEGSFSAPRCP